MNAIGRAVLCLVLLSLGVAAQAGLVEDMNVVAGKLVEAFPAT